MNELTYKTKRDNLENKFMAVGERRRGRDSYGVWDRHIHTAIFKMDSQQGPTI